MGSGVEVPSLNVSKLVNPSAIGLNSIPAKTVEYDFSDGGFANNMYGLITCYVVAALTNATLVCSSFLFLLHLVGNRYPLQDLFTVTDLSDNPVRVMQFPRSVHRKRLKMPNICFTKKSKVVQKLMVSPITRVFNADHIILSTNCPLFAWMLYNNETYSEIVRLGLLDDRPFESFSPSVHGFRLLSNIVRKHFIMNDDIRTAVQERRRIIGNDTCVAFHIRMGDKQSDFKEYRSFIFSGDIHAFSNCKVFQQYPNATIFVSSDSSFAKSVVLKDNSQRRVVTFSEKAQHSFSAVRSGKGRAVIHNLLVDIMTIASCDIVIGTYKSSFSLLAAAFQGNPPYWVARRSKCFLPDRIVY